MLTYFMWPLPLPRQIKVTLNILGGVLLFFGLRFLSQVTSPVGIFLPLTFLVSSLIFISVSISPSLSRTLIFTLLFLLLFFDFRFFVTSLSFSLVFFFLKAFTKGYGETYQNLLIRETKKSQKLVYQTKLREHQFLEYVFLSLFLIITFCINYLFLIQGEKAGERDLATVYQNIFLSVAVGLSLFHTIERKQHSSS